MNVKDKAIAIVRKLVRQGFIAYFAGGWVRDYLMGHPSYDIDIATNASPAEILDLFPCTIPVGLSFGVVIVVYEGHNFEVSTFRRDIAYSNGRQPERIEQSSPEEDAIRRDFTINGMFYDPLEDNLYDYVNGREDIQKGIIRAIGNPSERFFEDRLRMVRAVRFAARFGFHIDLETQEGIIAYAANLFPAVAMERIWQEFTKMASSPRFDQAILDLHKLGLLGVIFPQLKHLHLHDLRHIVAVYHHFPLGTPTILYLIELFPHAKVEELRDVCNYLRISGQDTKLMEFVHTHRTHGIPTDKVSLAHFYAHFHSQLCLQVTAAKLHKSEKESFLKLHGAQEKSLAQHVQRLVEKKPLVHGSLLKEHGIPEGKRMGFLLKEAERLIITHDLEDPSEVIALLTKSPNWKPT